MRTARQYVPCVRPGRTRRGMVSACGWEHARHGNQRRRRVDSEASLVRREEDRFDGEANGVRLNV